MDLILITSPCGEFEMLFINDDLRLIDSDIDSNTLLSVLEDFTPLLVNKIEIKKLTWKAVNKYGNEFPKVLSNFQDTDFD